MNRAKMLERENSPVPGGMDGAYESGVASGQPIALSTTRSVRDSFNDRDASSRANDKRPGLSSLSS
jgi:hypothetical protein